MGTIKDRNGMDLIEAEDIKRRWKQYTGELYKKSLNDPDNYGGITHLARHPGVWSQVDLRKLYKASRGDGIPAELFQNLKDDAVKVLLNMPASLENSAVATGLEKVSFHSNPKECSNYCTIALISQASKVMLKNPSS